MWLLVLAAAGCGSDPTPVPTATAVIDPGPTVAPSEAGEIPAQVLGRYARVQTYVVNEDSTPFAAATPIPNIVLRIKFTNNTGKDLRAFKGVLSFRDAQGNKIESFLRQILSPVKAGDSVVADFPVIDSEFMRDRQALKTRPTSEIAVVFRPTVLTLEDGSRVPVEGGTSP
jgi:hypothetical protein